MAFCACCEPAQKETYLMEHRLEMFQPSPKQYDFFVQADKRRRACFAGNRFGKFTGVVEDCSWLLGRGRSFRWGTHQAPWYS